MPSKVPSDGPGQFSQSNRKPRVLLFQNQTGYLRDKAVSAAVAVALGIIALLAFLIPITP